MTFLLGFELDGRAQSAGVFGTIRDAHAHAVPRLTLTRGAFVGQTTRRIACHVLPERGTTREMPEGCPRHFGAMPHHMMVIRGSRAAGANESRRGDGRPYAPLIVSIGTHEQQLQGDQRSRTGGVGHALLITASMEHTHEKYQRLIARCKTLQPVPCAVAHPCDESSLRGAIEAAQEGLIRPCWSDRRQRIKRVAADFRLDIAGCPIVDAPHSEAAAEAAVSARARRQGRGADEGQPAHRRADGRRGQARNRLAHQRGASAIAS